MFQKIITFLCCFFVSTIVSAQTPAPSPEMLDQVARLKAKEIPLIDYHIHLRGDMTAQKAHDWEKKTGVRSGVLENTGHGWPLSDNEKLADFIAEARKFPVLVGIQVNDRDWFKTISKENTANLDYVLADTMIMAGAEVMPGTNGKPQKLWLENEYEIKDPKAWLDRYFEHCMTVVNEPIDILANPTYLPTRMEKYYDEFWNADRMGRFIDAAVKNDVAFEIQSPTKFPKKAFLELARQKGAKLTIGRNNHNDKVDELKRSLDMLEELNVKPDEMLVLPKLFAKSKTKIRRILVGELDFYSIEDAPLEIENDLLITDDKELLKRLAPSGKSPSSFGVFVVKKGPDAVLIDTGTGGDMLKHLQTIGVKPEDIKTVLLTHSHDDHVGGLVKDGQKVFPNAELRLNAKELEFWKSAQNKERCEQVLKLYGNPKFLTPDEKSSVIFPEMVAVDLAGHTPGHTGFLICSGDAKLLFVADLLHAGAVQFAAPNVKFRFDNDPEQGVEIRHKTMKRAAEENLLFVGSHLPFPCAGYVKTEGNAFRFVPISEKDKGSLLIDER